MPHGGGQAGWAVIYAHGPIVGTDRVAPPATRPWPLSAPSLEESRQFAEADPAVRAGRFAVEIMTWYCPPGTMSKPGRLVTV